MTIQVEHSDFVSIPTRDVERSRAFYTETLGLPESHSTPFGFEVETENLTLNISDSAAIGREFKANPSPVALRVPDVAVAREELEQAGVKFFGETIDTGVCHMAVFADPDGNTLTLHRRYAPR